MRACATPLLLLLSAIAVAAGTPELAEDLGRAVDRELAPLPTFDGAAFTAKALKKFQLRRPPALNKAAIERQALRDLGWDKPPSDRGATGLFAPVVKEKLNREFPPAARTEVYRQAKALHGLHRKGDQVSVKVQRGDSLVEFGGTFNGFSPGGDIAYIGSEKVYRFELPRSFLDRVDENVALDRQRQYINDNFDLPREQRAKKLEQRYHHEFGTYDHMLQVLQEERRELIEQYNRYFDEISAGSFDKYQKELRNPALTRAVDKFMADRSGKHLEALAADLPNDPGRPLILKLLPFDSGLAARLKASERLAADLKAQLADLCAARRLARAEDIPIVLSGSAAYSDLVKKTVPELTAQLGALTFKLTVGLAVGLLAALGALALAILAWGNRRRKRTRKWRVKA